MAGRLLTLSAQALRVRKVPFGAASNYQFTKAIIGNREVVGFGINGEPNYVDRSDFPLPAIRWQETTPDIQVYRFISVLFVLKQRLVLGSS